MLELKKYVSIGEEEKRAACEVIDSGLLSGFVAGHPDNRDIPNGGPTVRALEDEWARKYGVKHALSFNSATSALYAAYAAADVRPEDHVITTPWTMSATAAAAIAHGAVIDFADIESKTFNIDPSRVEHILRRNLRDGIPTKAVCAVNLFGHTANIHFLRGVCDGAGIVLIEDSAQTPWADSHGKTSGTVGHIGVYSLNRHKHIHCGEGGIAVTDDDNLARRIRSVRNHGVKPLGLNLRMTEVDAAIAFVQLRNIEKHVQARREFGAALSAGLKDLMEVPEVLPMHKHDYYMWTAKTDRWPKDVPHISGYIQPLHWIFKGGYGVCPEVEKMRERVVCFETCKYDPSEAPRIIDAVREAFL